MGGRLQRLRGSLRVGRQPVPMPSLPALEPVPPAALRALLYSGENDSDACERVLAQTARLQGALELAVGDGLAALAEGDGLIRLGCSCLKDYAREALDLKERTAQAMAHLSRELRRRPLLRAAVRAGEVRIRHAQTVLPVAVGEGEALWVERARSETVRALEAAVRQAGAGGGDEEEWMRLRAPLSTEERATVDEALGIAGKLLPGSSRAQRLEALAQEYIGEHPVEAGEEDGAARGGPFRPDRRRQEALREQLEVETDRWSYLDVTAAVAVPEIDFGALPAEEIDDELRALAAERREWDGVLGYCAYAVKRSGLWKLAGFATFEHYCEERLGLSARAVEQRAALERRLWARPRLRAARDGGLAYEKVRLLSRLADRELEEWLPRARELTCVALRAALEERDEAQMRAAKVLGARVPEGTAVLLQAAFRAVRAVEGMLLSAGRCLVAIARHFIATWKGHVKRAQTVSQKVRERDLGRCQAPGCSRRAVHSHHIIPRSRGGGDEPENQVALCACHHLRGIHGGYMRVSGRAPDALAWELVYDALRVPERSAA